MSASPWSTPVISRRGLAPAALVADEVEALLTRLGQLGPFALRMAMVPAAAPSAEAVVAMRDWLGPTRARLEAQARDLLRWLAAEGRSASPDRVQARYVGLRVAFHGALTSAELFADVLSQRGEHGAGTALAGLDVLADDALSFPGVYRNPPLVTYLDATLGAAIRRVRTPLPGGGPNPVAIIRVPRERMIGSGVAGSLIHEVGHQSAALLDLVDAGRSALRRLPARPPLRCWDAWLGEILSDLWAVSRVGITATRGLMNVMSLPRAFVYHLTTRDPHPGAWIRVLLSCALGEALYPDPQWAALARAWRALYPLSAAPPAALAANRRLASDLPTFAAELLAVRPRSLGGRTLGEALRMPERTPDRLRRLRDRAVRLPVSLRPTLLIAALGQARHEGRLDAATEAALLTRALTRWGLARAELTARRAVGGCVPPDTRKPT